MGRATLSVLAGFAVWSVLWLGQNQILLKFFPEHFDEGGFTTAGHVLGIVLVLSVIDSVLAGWVTGVLAAAKEAARSLSLGVVLLIVGAGVQAGIWDKMPLWYHLSFLALLVPASVVGGRLAAARRRRSS